MNKQEVQKRVSQFGNPLKLNVFIYNKFNEVILNKGTQLIIKKITNLNYKKDIKK